MVFLFRCDISLMCRLSLTTDNSVDLTNVSCQQFRCLRSHEAFYKLVFWSWKDSCTKKSESSLTLMYKRPRNYSRQLSFEHTSYPSRFVVTFVDEKTQNNERFTQQNWSDDMLLQHTTVTTYEHLQKLLKRTAATGNILGLLNRQKILGITDNNINFAVLA